MGTASREVAPKPRLDEVANVLTEVRKTLLGDLRQ
jgi:hypothetical protein